MMGYQGTKKLPHVEYGSKFVAKPFHRFSKRIRSMNEADRQRLDAAGFTVEGIAAIASGELLELAHPLPSDTEIMLSFVQAAEKLHADLGRMLEQIKARIK